MKNKHFFYRLGFAFTGLCSAIAQEKSLRLHLIAAIAVIVLMLILQPPLYWWAIIFLAIAMVISAEMFNTAIEAVCDFIQPNNDERIRYIKDVAAGAVLVTSMGAVLVALMLILVLFF